MSSNDDRERSLERLLKTPLPMGEAADDCVDAEQLAAWSDGGLDESSARQVEQHLSTCARCQAVAAAFARTAPAVTTTPARAAWGMRWLLPAGVAAAAAMAISIVAPWRSVTPTPEMSMARNEPSAELPTAASPTPASAPSSPRQNDATGQALPEAPTSRRADQATSRPVATQRPGAALVDGGAPQLARQSASAAKAEAAAPVEAPRDAVAERSAVAAGAPPPAAAPPPPASSSPTGAGRASGRAQGVNVTAEAPLIQAQSGERSFSVGSENLALATGGSLAVAEFVAAQPPPASSDMRVGGAGRSGIAVVALPIRWRVLADGRVQRSANGAASWEAVELPAGVHVNAGAAPAPLVCWLIGTQGTVLLSTDGQRFTRVASPDTSDLREISTTDARVATVTTRDNQAFATTDGGATWRALVR